MSCNDTYKNRLNSFLNTEFIGRNFVFKEETDSTNSLAKRENENSSGTVFMADFQTNGRGRRGNTWISKKNEGLWFSILLKPDRFLEKLSCITLVMGLAVNYALNKITGTKTFIKWPNDIVLNNKKVCGILCEISYKNNEVDYIILGVGINLYTEKFDDEIKKIATSVFLETGKKIDKFELLAEILNQFEPLYFEYLKNGMKNIINDYKINCVTLDREVLVVMGDEKYKAYAKDINKDGELIVLVDGKSVAVSSGEVSVRGLFGYV